MPLTLPAASGRRSSLPPCLMQATEAGLAMPMDGFVSLCSGVGDDVAQADKARTSSVAAMIFIECSEEGALRDYSPANGTYHPDASEVLPRQRYAWRVQWHAWKWMTWSKLP